MHCFSVHNICSGLLCLTLLSLVPGQAGNLSNQREIKAASPGSEQTGSDSEAIHFVVMFPFLGQLILPHQPDWLLLLCPSSNR